MRTANHPSSFIINFLVHIIFTSLRVVQRPSQLYVRYVHKNKYFHKGERQCSRGSERWSGGVEEHIKKP